MWFFGFVLAVATCISLGVFGWASYLEHMGAAARTVSASQASVPLPPRRPPRPKVQVPKADTQVEVVREPKADATQQAHGRRVRKTRATGRGRPRQAQRYETW